ncbi:MAG: hypothetical protein H0T73_15840, partial [Ardenticatenales bacterium]|nr:hypothetical protein [Ardenticatenales bacterium]
MRRILLLLLVLCSLPACDAMSPQEASPYQLLIASADLSPQTPRLALVLWDGPEKLTGVQSLDVGLYTVGNEGEIAEKLWEGTATSYQMGDIQYWVAYPDFPAAGTYGVQATFKTAEGRIFE